MSRRVALLSPGGAFADDVLAALHARGGAVDALVLYAGNVVREWRKAPGGLRRAATLPLVPVRWAGRRIRRRLRPRPPAAHRVVFAGPVDGRGVLGAVRRLEPDVLFLAHCSLVSPALLALPREGTVNVHPALLPWVRGSSPLGNSLLRGVPLGATTFRVDAGIDTGAILARRLLPVAGGESADALRGALHRLWVEMTVDAIVAATAAPLPAGTPQRERFPLCRTLSPADALAVDEAIRAGAPRALFERWRAHATGPGLDLPADAHVPVGTGPAR